MAVECCAGDKVTSLDGFMLAFFWHFWRIVKANVVSIMMSF